MNLKLNLFKEELKQYGYIFEKTILTRKSYLLKVVCNQKDVNYFVKGIYLKDLFKSEFLKYQLSKELKIVKSIKTNSIYLQNFYDFFYTKNFAIFVYEYFPFGNISMKYKNVVMKKEEILIIIKDVFLGLDELRKSNIYHKYLCEEYIYFYKNNFKIGGFEFCDFVNCSKLSEINNYKFIKSVNNINTLAPEIIFNRHTGSKTAYFSLGVIIYHLINKQYPLNNANLEYLKSIYMNNSMKIDYKNINEELKFLIYNFLLVDYNHRISSYNLKEEIFFINKKYLKKNYEQERKNLFFNNSLSKKSIVNDSIGKNNNFLSSQKSKKNIANSNFMKILKFSNKNISINKIDNYNPNDWFSKYSNKKKNKWILYQNFKNTNFNNFKILDKFKNKNNNKYKINIK